MNTFSLKITACDRVFYEGECEILIFPVEDGEMAILAHHEQVGRACVLNSCVIADASQQARQGSLGKRIGRCHGAEHRPSGCAFGQRG